MSPFRKYRSDADPSPFMGAIRSMSFSAGQMHKRYNGIQRQFRKTPDGEVTLMRVGDIEYINITPEVSLGIFYAIVYYSLEKKELHIKFLNKQKEDVFDIEYWSLYRRNPEKFEEIIRLIFNSAEHKMGNLILLAQYGTGRLKPFYNTSTGLLEDFVLSDNYTIIYGALVVDDYTVYLSAYEYDESGVSTGNYMHKVTITIKDGKYEFSVISKIFKLYSFPMLLDGEDFNWIDSVPYYANIYTVDKDSLATTLVGEGYFKQNPNDYEYKSFSSLYSYDIVKYNLSEKWQTSVSVIPSKTMNFAGEGVYSGGWSAVATDFFGENIYYIRSASSPYVYEACLRDGTVIYRDLYASPLHVVRWKGFIGDDGKEINNLKYYRPGFDYHSVANPEDQYIIQNGEKITIENLSLQFKIPVGDTIVYMTYLPNFGKNPAVAALLR